MLPSRAVCTLKTPNRGWCLSSQEWKLLPESRFGEGLVSTSSHPYKYIDIKKKKLRVLSPQTKYTCYLVYKIERGGCTSPMLVWHKDSGSGEWEYGSHFYLVSPQTPIIRTKAGQNTQKPLYRPKLKGIPQQRSDGWMEVQVWEFQVDTSMTVIPSLRLEYLGCTYREEYLKRVDYNGHSVQTHIDHWRWINSCGCRGVQTLI
uniref:uncharacterized protein LOC122585508 n=1 Tax=Erigeron canadensis TaxID=72917 RepID=UPI001CB9345A|nr:uncharacterized protein LOC122585508 [Erigeron canadensis]